MLVHGGLSHLGLIFPGLEPGPPLLPITDPANLASDNPAVAAAAAAKAEEDQAEQKIKAIRYLATLGCAGCYPGIEEALLAALDDCTERVRYEAVRALRDLSGNPCSSCKEKACCSEKVRKKLDDIANKTNDEDCFLEPSERVRRLARAGLSNCGTPPVTPEPNNPEEGPNDEDLPGANVAGKKSGKNQPHLAEANAAIKGLAGLNAGSDSTQQQPMQDSQVQPASHQEADGLRTADRGMLLALVHQQPIFAGDLNVEVQQQLDRLKSTVAPPMLSQLEDQIQQRTLQRAIDRKLLVHQARTGLPGKEVVELERSLAAVHVGGEEREDALAALWLKRHVTIDRHVTMTEIEQAYRAAPQKYVRPPQVRWRQVTAPIASFAQPQLALATLTAVRQQRLGQPAPPVQPAVMAQLRTADHDWTVREKMPNPALGQLAFDLPPGEPSPILEGKDGFFFLEVAERRGVQAGALEEVADTIREEILDRRRIQAEQAYLRHLRTQGGVWTSTAQIPTGQTSSTQAPPTQQQSVAEPVPSGSPAPAGPTFRLLPLPDSARLPASAGDPVLR